MLPLLGRYLQLSLGLRSTLFPECLCRCLSFMAAASTGADFGVLCGTTNSEAHTLLRADLTPLCPGRIMDGFSSMRGPQVQLSIQEKTLPCCFLCIYLQQENSPSYIYTILSATSPTCLPHQSLGTSTALPKDFQASPPPRMLF